MQLLKDPTTPGMNREPQRVCHREGMKDNLADDCIFVVLTKKQIFSEMAVGGVGGASASGASLVGSGR